MTDTALPYGGAANPNSGWSGSETSRSRAERDDADGTTSRRQRQIITMLAMRGTTGRRVVDCRTCTRSGPSHG